MKIKFVKGFRFKIIFYITIIFIVIMFINTYFSISSMYEHLTNSNKNNILANLNFASREIEKANALAVKTGEIMAYAQEGGMFGEREKTIEMVKNVLTTNHDLYDAYVIYEPNADGADSRYKNQKYYDSTGRFNFVWNHINESYMFLPAVEMETSLYYDGLKKKLTSGSTEKYMITEPYLYNNSVIMLEQTFPILINNKFVGIAGCDRKLDDITNYLAALKPYKSADFLLVSRLGGIVVSTNDKSQLTKNINEIEQKDILNYLLKNENIKKFYDPMEKKNYYFAVSHVNTGDWSLFMRVAEDELMDPIYNTIYKQIAYSIVFLLILFIVLVWIVNSVVKPISLAAKAAQRVASGDLTVKVSYNKNDEAGALLGAVQNMTLSLNSIVKQVQKTAVRIVSSSTEIFATTKHLQAVASEQAEFANEVLSATTEIAASSNQLSSSMSNVTEISERTLESAKSSSSYLESMEKAINQMLQASRAISQKLAIINNKAGSISTIITTINKVAEQTNILSLNASIEAEKAGEFGRGFAVIAREIRRLADETSVGTMNIESMVRDMQSAVSTGVMEMDKFTSEVENSAKEMSSVSKKLELIVDEVRQLTPRFGEINDSMKFQLEGTEHITTSITKLNQGARQIFSSLNEFNVVTTELKNETNSLKNEVSNFKISN